MIVRFATSDAGKVYGRTCARFGVDPGAVLDDDVMAANLRVALVLGDLEPVEPPDPYADARAKTQEAFS